ncbi:MAG: thermonuclease family protein [Proteobacteria bacterium]|nr:thermonuclease family protein [Pseudomonadota bacterium]
MKAARFIFALLRAGLLALTLLASQPGIGANTLHGRVIAVADGDTITVLDAQKHQWRIRLAAIDAPEHGQAYGTASRQALAARVFRRDVTVLWAHYDRYDRIVGKVMVDGTDANLAQVADGMAWHYRQYAREQSAGDRHAYATAEAWARKRGIGLWADAHPVAPWKFRHE